MSDEHSCILSSEAKSRWCSPSIGLSRLGRLSREQVDRRHTRCCNERDSEWIGRCRRTALPSDVADRSQIVESGHCCSLLTRAIEGVPSWRLRNRQYREMMIGFSRTCSVGNRSNQVHIVKNERSQARMNQLCAREKRRWYFPPHVRERSSSDSI